MRSDPPAKRQLAYWYERVISGELYWFQNAPDLSVLCLIGRRLFRQWEQAALLTVEVARRKSQCDDIGSQGVHR
jgi:hypothetical protein